MGRPRKSDSAPEQQIEVTEGPVKRDLAYIPEFLSIYFAESGKRVSLACADPSSIAKCSLYARRPIRVKDLGEEAEKFVDLLTGEYGFTMVNEKFGKGDCLLYQQPYSAFEEQMSEGREVNDQQYGQAGFETDLGAIDEILRKAGAGRVESKYRETQQIGQLGNPSQ